jgi:2-dehydro-3-deoxygluconokinase
VVPAASVSVKGECVLEQRSSGVDVACVGETMLLLVPDPPRPPEDAETFRREIGGAESNVAIHLARRARRAAWVSALGDDAFGRFVRARVRAEGVGCDAVRVVPDHPTGLYVKELRSAGTSVAYYRSGSAACTLGPSDAEAVWALRPRLVHTTGITAVLSPSCEQLVRALFADAPGATLRSFDVNFRPGLHTSPETAELLRELALRADVVFCGLDEAQALWGARHPEDVAALLGGTGSVVVKQGAAGATAFQNSTVYHQPAPAVHVVEPVGAGDAFAAGVLDGVLDEADWGECLRRGSELAGPVLQVDTDLPPPAAGAAFTRSAAAVHKKQGDR